MEKQPDVARLEKPPYKGRSGSFLMQALFWHYYTCNLERAKYYPVFCLRHTDDTRAAGMISVYDTFVALGDVTGHKWAMEYLGSWEHWLRLIQLDWFKDTYEAACSEISNKLKAEALQRIHQIAQEGSDAQALNAAKYLAEGGWMGPSKKTTKRGRPSKEEVAGALKEQVRLTKEEEEDLARINNAPLRLVKK